MAALTYRQVLRNDQFKNLWAGSFFSGLGEAVGQVALPLAGLRHDQLGRADERHLRPADAAARDSLALSRVCSPTISTAARSCWPPTRCAPGRSSSCPLSKRPLSSGSSRSCSGWGKPLPCLPRWRCSPPSSMPRRWSPRSRSCRLLERSRASSDRRLARPSSASPAPGRPSGSRRPATPSRSSGTGGWCCRRRTGDRAIRLPAILRNSTKEMRQGFHTIWTTPILRGVCITEGLWSLIFGVLSITMVVYFEETLDLGDRADFLYGLLAVSMSSGAVVGALTASHLERRISRSNMLFVGYLGPLIMVPAVLQPPVPVLYVLAFAIRAGRCLGGHRHAGVHGRMDRQRDARPGLRHLGRGDRGVGAGLVRRHRLGDRSASDRPSPWRWLG